MCFPKQARLVAPTGGPQTPDDRATTGGAWVPFEDEDEEEDEEAAAAASAGHGGRSKILVKPSRTEVPCPCVVPARIEAIPGLRNTPNKNL